MAEVFEGSRSLRVESVSDAGDRNLRFKIRGVGTPDDTLTLYKAYDITNTYVTNDKSMICLLVKDEIENVPLLKVSHRIGIPSVTICSPAGILIGETISELKIRCCSIKPTYTLLSRFGKQLLVMKGKIRCFPPGYQINIKSGGTAGKDLAEIRMTTLSAYSCQIQFTSKEKISENSRNLIIGVGIGMILQSQYAQSGKKVN